MIRCFGENDNDYKKQLLKIMKYINKNQEVIKEYYNHDDFREKLLFIWNPMNKAVYNDFDGQHDVENLFIATSKTHYYFNVCTESYEYGNEDESYFYEESFVAYFTEIIFSKDFKEWYFMKSDNTVDKWYVDSEGITKHAKFECNYTIPTLESDEEKINKAISILEKSNKLASLSKKEKALSVYEFWLLLNKLKEVIRTGWLRSNVNKKRLEVVAEHVYSTGNLAIAMASQFGYAVDLYKVVFMIAIHEIGDIPINEQKENKKQKEREAVIQIIDELIVKDELLSIYDEFEERKTPEAKFAFQCDKVDCDLQSTVYQKYVSDPNWSENWIDGDIKRYNYDENFKAVAEVAIEKVRSKNGK